MQNFEDYLCERNDTIDNTAYQLIGVLPAEGPGRIRVSFKTVQGSVSWDTCYTPRGMCPAFNYTSITYPC